MRLSTICGGYPAALRQALTGDASLPQRPQQKARGVDVFSEIALQWPRLAFYLRGDQFRAKRRPHETTRAISERAIQAFHAWQIERPCAAQTLGVARGERFIGDVADHRHAVARHAAKCD